MNFVYKRRGGPLLSWENGYPPRQSQGADARSLGALGNVVLPMPGAPEHIATADYVAVGADEPGMNIGTGMTVGTTADKLVSYAGLGAGAYHGYKRTGSIAWAIGWSILGSIFPIPTVVVAAVQGFGKPKK
jgi:hypothetical protein